MQVIHLKGFQNAFDIQRYMYKRMKYQAVLQIMEYSRNASEAKLQSGVIILYHGRKVESTLANYSLLLVSQITTIRATHFRWVAHKYKSDFYTQRK